MRTSKALLLLYAIVFLMKTSNFAAIASEDDKLMQECSAKFQDVMPCLDFATGKAESPTKECCGSVKDIRDKEPQCLCFVLLQAHKGNAQLSSFGVQEAKLLQLPSACQLQNSSISLCPKILGLAAGSPDAAIFEDKSTPAAPVTSTPPSTGAPPTDNQLKSSGFKSTACIPFVVAVSLLIYGVLPSGYGSLFYI